MHGILKKAGLGHTGNASLGITDQDEGYRASLQQGDVVKVRLKGKCEMQKEKGTQFSTTWSKGDISILNHDIFCFRAIAYIIWYILFYVHTAIYDHCYGFIFLDSLSPIRYVIILVHARIN